IISLIREHIIDFNTPVILAPTQANPNNSVWVPINQTIFTIQSSSPNIGRISRVYIINTDLK
ncbi:MAG: hypothetical protein PHP68_02090, partial [Oscillospiraceae bacterium]|nr:hypothetical protein [Oscillospiraceae bacterium]